MKKMGRPKLNLVRFTVSTTEEVKQALEAQALLEGRSLSVQAGRMLAKALGLPPLPEADQPKT